MGLEWAAGGTNGRKSRRKASPWLNQRERDPRRDGELSANWRDPAFSTACPFPFARKHRCTSFSLSLPFQLPFFLPKPFLLDTLPLSLSLPRSLAPFFQGPINGSSPWPRSFVRSGCRATPLGKISSQVSSDTRGVTYRRGPSAGIVASLELAPG